MEYRACLIYIRSQSSAQGEQIILQGRTEGDKSFGIAITNFKPRFFVRERDLARVESELNTAGLQFQRSKRPDFFCMDEEPAFKLECRNSPELRNINNLLTALKIPVYESDLNSTQQYLIDQSIGMYFIFSGEASSSDRVDIKCINPKITPIEDGESIRPALRILAMDIETSRKGHIRCISISQENRAARKNTVLSLQAPGNTQIDAETIEDYRLQIYKSEAELLSSFSKLITELDPDIITGWNVIGFDMAVILRRMAELHVPADFGRSSIPAAFTPGSGDMPDLAEVPGRQVIDAMRLQRMHPRHFESYSLENVARELLGRGKAEEFNGESKMDELDRLWAEEPKRFLDYCMEDSLLVLEILNKTGLMDLSIKRSQLCKTSLSRSWASIHSFEQLYTTELHKRQIVSPNYGVDRLAMNESPGGTIISPSSGKYPRVLLLDFKGLYPSIIRSFGIDPLSHIRARSPRKAENTEIIYSPNSTAFLKEGGILPEILNEFYALREDAKNTGDDIGSFTYKILANSFYGVLGSPGCRFAGSDIATSITGFAKEILLWSKAFAEDKGFDCIYGDTDSLFLIPPQEDPDSDLPVKGGKLVVELNSAISAWIKEKYNTKSLLEIEFETIFSPLYIPPLKSVASQEITRSLSNLGLDAPQGRAKSYAGMAYDPRRYSDAPPALVIKGMEAVRSDYTAAARRIQRELLEMIFTGSGQEDVKEYLIAQIQAIKNGTIKKELLLQKRLSKAASEYKGAIPPHVRAALKAEEMRKGKPSLRRIRYVISSEGPEPCLSDSALEDITPDLGWYMEKQILPVIQSIAAAADWDLEEDSKSLSSANGQLHLW